MITKHDIRLGNMFEQGIVWKLSGRAGSKVHLHGKGKWYKGFRSEVDVERLNPIGLSEEVLCDWCGFKKVDGTYFSPRFGGNYQIRVLERDGEYFYMSGNIPVKLRGLHELQNLWYVLAGENLRITEFVTKTDNQ